MDFIFSKHAERELRQRRIARAFVTEVLRNPEQIVPERPPRETYQSRLDFGGGKIYLLRVIVDVAAYPPMAVTVYRTSNISKYWRQP